MQSQLHSAAIGRGSLSAKADPVFFRSFFAMTGSLMMMIGCPKTVTDMSPPGSSHILLVKLTNDG